MNKQSMVLGGAFVNLLLLGALVYVWWLAPRTTEHTLHQPGRLGPNAPHYKIAFMHTFQTRDFEEERQGFIDTIRDEAQFVPEMKIFDANNSRTLMHNSIEEVLENDYDLVVVTASQGAQMLREMTAKRGNNVPVIFLGTGDPVKLELVKSLESSGNNLTGVSMLGDKWVDGMASLTSLVLPKVQNILIPYNPNSLGGAVVSYAERLAEACKKQGYDVHMMEVFNHGEVMERVSARISDTDLIMVMPDATMIESVGALSKLGEQHGIGVFVAFNMSQITEGATMCYGVQPYDVGVEGARAARLILEDKVLPTNIPVNGMYDAYRLALNVDTARAHGLLDQIDPTLLFLMEHGEVI
jgi:ABC-type uncharacterized transport system substrate-binding protein